MSEMVSMEEYENTQRQEEYENSQRQEDTLCPADDLHPGNTAPAPFPREEIKKKKLFAFWQVGEENYRMKLLTPEQLELEKIYKRNLFSLMGDADNLPPLSTMLQITHASMKPYYHGVKLKDVENLYGRYIEAGGSMLQFYVDVYMQIFAVSGFFSSSMEKDLSESMGKLSDEMK